MSRCVFVKDNFKIFANIYNVTNARYQEVGTIGGTENKAKRILLDLKIKIDFASVCNLLSVLNSFRHVAENLAHLRLGLYIKFLGFKGHSVLVIDSFLHLNTHKNIFICNTRYCNCRI